LTVFDAAAVEECYRRQESVVPQQALALENSDFVWDRARRITQGLESESRCQPVVGRISTPSHDGNDEGFVIAAFEHILGRAPQLAELKACERFLTRQERLLAAPTRLTPFPPPARAPMKGDRIPPGLPLVLGVTQKLAKAN